MGRLDHLVEQFSNEQFQQGVQSDLDMITLETMRQNAQRDGRLGGGGRRGHATTGWKNRGIFFWIMLIIGIYWFFLRPLGL